MKSFKLNGITESNLTKARGLCYNISMQKDIEALMSATLEKIGQAMDTKELAVLKVDTLGKSGSFTAILKGMKDLSAEDRPVIGKLVNEARDKLERVFLSNEQRLHILEVNETLKNNQQDVSIDKKIQMGSLHPLHIVKQRIIKFFVGLGFWVEDSPEIESEYYNFTALNVPADHPARDMQDTFWLSNHLLLRSQTSNGQIRTMEQKKPPLKMLSPGRVYRADEIDATHSPCFHQIEGLVVDKNITMCDLKGVLEAFAKEFFGAQTKIRFRPSYFPFTEPSVEVDASCFACGGNGCRICKGTGYIEVLGAGMVNKKVLQNCGIDDTVYSGFAFGMGLERLTNILYQIGDMRALFDNDVRFLRQFQ